jgi:hypothetical protein
MTAENFSETLKAAARAGLLAAPARDKAHAEAATAATSEIQMALIDVGVIAELLEMAGCAADAGTFEPSGEMLTWLGARLGEMRTRISGLCDAPERAAGAAVEAATSDDASLTITGGLCVDGRRANPACESL